MVLFRAILPFVFLAAVCAPGVGWAAEEVVAAGGMRVAQAVQMEVESGAESMAQTDDNRRPATRRDIARLDARMGRMEVRVDTQISELRREMKRMFYLVLVLMVALFGVPQFPNWWEKLRRNGRVATATGVFLAMLSMLLAGAAIAGVFS